MPVLKGGVAALDSSISAGGEWSPLEAEQHINCLDLQAAFFALKTLCHVRNTHIRIMLDNTMAVSSYINAMGGSHSLACNSIAMKIWEWAIDRNIWLSACHIPGVLNVTADRESRVFHKETEWKLNETILCSALKS